MSVTPPPFSNSLPITPADAFTHGGSDRVVAELQRLRQAEEERQRSSEQTKQRIIIGMLLAVLAMVLLWSTGRMDGWLVNVGLNKNDCYKNGFGATFCGDDAKAYQRQVDQIVGGSTAGSFSDDDALSAQSNLRAAIPAIEAYAADHWNSYEGMTVGALQELDLAITSVVVGPVTSETYCIESTVGSQTYSIGGPDGDILPGAC